MKEMKSSRRTALTESEKNMLDSLFLDYKDKLGFSTSKIASIAHLDRTTIGKYYHRNFGEEYLKLVKIKNKFKKPLTEECKLKISSKLKGKIKPLRSEEHKIKLRLALLGKTYEQRFGNMANLIKQNISTANSGKKRDFRSNEWRQNLSNSLKGRTVWNKNKRGLQKAWNRSTLPEGAIVKLYSNNLLSSKKIARLYKVSNSVIIRILKENNINLRNNSDYLRGKSYEDMYGTEKARKLKERISERTKGRKITWQDKISKALKDHYASHPISNEIRQKRSNMMKKFWSNPDQRKKHSLKEIEYLRKNPKALERLKNIQPLKGPSSVEKKMLDFLRNYFKEGKDFFFDQQDISGKTLYRPDFQFPVKSIILEINGYYKHFTNEGKQKDIIREYYLKKAGWKVFNFNFNEISKEFLFEKVKEKILRLLQ